MKKAILFLLPLLPFIGISQNFIGKSKAEVKKELQKQIQKNNDLTITLADKGTALTYSIKDAKSLPADFIYGFDKSGKSQSEKVIAYCDSCYTKYLKAALAEKKYEWKKINENQYISNYASRMMIELPAESNELVYTILRTEWTKVLYKTLLGN